MSKQAAADADIVAHDASPQRAAERARALAEYQAHQVESDRVGELAGRYADTVVDGLLGLTAASLREVARHHMCIASRHVSGARKAALLAMMRSSAAVSYRTHYARWHAHDEPETYAGAWLTARGLTGATSTQASESVVRQRDGHVVRVSDALDAAG